MAKLKDDPVKDRDIGEAPKEPLSGIIGSNRNESAGGQFSSYTEFKERKSAGKLFITLKDSPLTANH